IAVSFDMMGSSYALSQQRLWHQMPTKSQEESISSLKRTKRAVGWTVRFHRAGNPDSRKEGSLKRIPLIAACLLWTPIAAVAQGPSGQTPNGMNTEQAIRQQDEQRIHAQVAADVIALRRIYADDFIGIGPTGV